MAVTVYRWTDSGAPALTNQNYEMAQILKACLVTGYGTRPAAGWTVPFENAGAQKLVLRQGGAQQRFYRLVDAVASGCFIRGYEAMTDIDTGTNPFPTVAQVGGNGLQLRRSTSGEPGPHRWIVVADSRTAYMAISKLGESLWTLEMVGDIASFKDGDQYKAALIGRGDGFTRPIVEPVATDQSQNGHFVDRSASGELSYRFGTHGWSSLMGDGFRRGTQTYPLPADGKLHLSQYWVHEPTTRAIRGRLRGLWWTTNVVTGLTDLMEITGTGALAAKRFLVLRDTEPVFGGPTGALILETSDTWEA